MIHHLGHLVRQGEMTISKTNRMEGWLQLLGQDALIRFELDSPDPSAMAGCRFTFQPQQAETSEATSAGESIQPAENLLLPEIESIQFGKLIALRVTDVQPPMFSHNHVELRVDVQFQCDFQLVWESHDGIIEIAFNPADLEMYWDEAVLRQSEELPESMLPSSFRDSITQRIEQIDKAYGEENGEYLISVKMPSDAQLEDLASFQLQTMVHKVEEGPKHRMIEFMKEISSQEKNILLCDLLEPPIETPAPEAMTDEQLQDKVTEILGRLSVLGVEFKCCEHFDDKLLYDWLVNKVIPWERIHPQLRQFQMTRFFDTSLWCDDCGIFQQL